jgi:hypothetical protein
MFCLTTYDEALTHSAYREGIEDLTGGVASFVRSENVLDKDKLWQELMQVNENFLFGCGTRKGRDSESADDEGFVRGHAYTVLAAHEIDPPPMDDKRKKSTKKQKEEEEKRKKEITKDGKIRLLKLHNPWGRQEFNGDWSDSSNRWTPELLKELGHTIGDDGTFFISFIDFLKFFPVIDRIRLIGPDWTVAQQWTSVNVPWTTDYLDTSFKFTITKPGQVVLVLSQPDTRYFKGLTGRYKYSLHFRLYQEGKDTYMLRSMEQSGNMRSCNAETYLQAGTYELLLKITAERFDDKRTPQQIIREYRDDRREKLLAVGKSFDLTHSKGKLREFEKTNLINDVKENRERVKERMSKDRELARRVRIASKKRRERIKDEIKKKREEKNKEHEEKMKKRREEAKKKREEERKKEEELNKENEKKRKERGGDDPEADATAGTSRPRERKSSSKDNTKGSEAGEDTATSDNELTADTMSEVDRVENLEPESPAGGEPRQKPADVPPIQAPTPEATPRPSVVAEISDKEGANEEEAVPPEAIVVFEPQTATKKNTVAESTTAVEKQVKPERKRGDHPVPKRGESSDYHEPHSPRRPHPRPPHHHRDRRNEFVDPRVQMYSDDDQPIIVDRNGPRMLPNGNPYRYPPPPPPGPHRPRGRSIGSDGSMNYSDRVFPSPVSSVCDDDFPFDSELDAPASMASSYESSSSSDSLDEMYPHDPWQATCVIGLRVCSLDESVNIEVVRGSTSRYGRSEIAMGRARSPA